MSKKIGLMEALHGASGKKLNVDPDLDLKIDFTIYSMAKINWFAYTVFFMVWSKT